MLWFVWKKKDAEKCALSSVEGLSIDRKEVTSNVRRMPIDLLLKEKAKSDCRYSYTKLSVDDEDAREMILKVVFKFD